MDNAVTMCTSQTLGRLDYKIDCFWNCQWTFFQTIFESSTFDVFHYNKGNVILFSKVMNLDDIWMSQFCYRTCFLGKPFYKNWISCMISRQYFDCNIAIECGLIGFKNRSHTTRSNMFDYSKLAKRFSNQ